jgi:tetratricopeptide (TPR) repeat protein
MEKNQALIVWGVLAAFVVVIGGAVYMNARGDGGIRAQRFRAAPGTQREKAEPIYADRKDGGSARSGTGRSSGKAASGQSTSGQGGGGGSGGDSGQTSSSQDASESDQGSSPQAPGESSGNPTQAGEESAESDAASDDLAAQKEEKSEAETKVMAALNAISADDGLRHLADAAATLTAQDAAADIYTAAAKLYLRSQPPNTDAAWAALQQGAAHATNPNEKAQVALAQATFLEQTGRPAEASQFLRDQFSDADEATSGTVQGLLQLGGLEEADGNADAAANAYTRAVDLAIGLLRSKDSEASGLYRQAVMRLSRLYRATGKTKEAEAIVEAMRARL